MSDEPKPPRVEILGDDGLHKRTRTWHEGDEGWKRNRDEWSQGVFWQELERQLAECGDILEEHGFARNDFGSDGFKEPYQDAWYAAQVGWRCDLVLNIWHRKGRAPNEAMLRYIMEIGALSTEWKWRLSYRPAILTGAKQRRHLTDLREGKNSAAKASVAERREAVAALMRETARTGGAIDKWLVQQLAEQHGIEVSARTVRDDRKALRG